MLLDDVREARRSAGWSQRTLAGRIGVDAQVIKRLERGVGTVEMLVRTMAALDFQLTGLPGGSTLALRLQARRRALGLSKEAAARRAGLSRPTVSSLERGTGSIASLLRLLAVLAPRVRRRALERTYWGAGDRQDRDMRFTPPDFMENIYAAFGEVDLDPCAHPLSPVRARRKIILGEGGDGLRDDWSGDLAFVNPPFSELLRWLQRAHQQWRNGNVTTVVCLVPVRTDSALFHDVVSGDAAIYLLRGRVRFLDVNGRGQQTPFSLMVLAFGADQAQLDRYAELVAGLWMTPRGTIERASAA